MLRCDATPWRQEHGPRVGLGSQRPGSLDRFSSWKMVGKNGRCSTVFFQKNGGFHGFVTEKSWEIWQISVSNRSVKSPEFMDLWSSKNWWSNGYLNIYIFRVHLSWDDPETGKILVNFVDVLTCSALELLCINALAGFKFHCLCLGQVASWGYFWIPKVWSDTTSWRMWHMCERTFRFFGDNPTPDNWYQNRIVFASRKWTCLSCVRFRCMSFLPHRQMVESSRLQTNSTIENPSVIFYLM